MRLPALAALVAATLLAGCDAPPMVQHGPSGPGAEVGTAPPGFQCPVAGTTIDFGDGRRHSYRGTDPSDPFICIAVTERGVTQHRLGNWFILPTPDVASIRHGFAPLFPLEPGRSADFIFEAFGPAGNRVMFRNNWRVVGQRTARISGVDRQVLVLECEVSTAMGGHYAVRWTYAWDIEARSIVAGNIRVLRGADYSRNWAAAAIEVPGMPGASGELLPAGLAAPPSDLAVPR